MNSNQHAAPKELDFCCCGEKGNNKVIWERFENWYTSVSVTVHQLFSKVFYNLLTRDIAEEKKERERESCRLVGIKMRETDRLSFRQTDRQEEKSAKENRQMNTHSRFCACAGTE